MKRNLSISEPLFSKWFSKAFRGLRVLCGGIIICLAALAVGAGAQVRVERDAQGRIVITNKGSNASKALASPSAQMPKVSSAARAEIRQKLRAACERHGLDYDLVTSLVKAESGFQHYTLSKRGAIGLMQLMPETARRFGVKDPWDLDQNIEGGTSFLATLQGLFPNKVPLVLAAYNAGENAVAKYGNKIPPYAETVRYVFAILEDYGKRGLVEEAKRLLATPQDFDRFYVPFRNVAPALRVMYMSVSDKGVRSFSDYPPSGVQSTPIVFKDE